MTTQNPIPNPAPTAETGAPNDYWLNSVRRNLRDKPFWVREQMSGDSTNGVAAAGAVPFRVGSPPIYDEASTPPASIKLSVGGTNYTVITTGTPSGSQVLVDFDSGELTFPTPPASGTNNIFVSYQKVNWTDSMILEQLYAGLRAMWPKVGKVYADSEATININTWDYDVPAWAQEPHAEIFGVEIQQNGIATEPFRPIHAWDRVGPTKLTIPQSQSWAINSKIRVSGVGPYMRLGDLEPSLYQLPILYATGMLLLDSDAVDERDDRMPAVAGEAARHLYPGQKANTAQWYLREFNRALDQAKHVPTGWKKKIVTTYDRQRYGGPVS